MIFHEVKSEDFIEIYLNLEELSCLSKLTNQVCFLKISDKWKAVFNLKNFTLTDYVPKNFFTCDLANYVCMFDEDINDIDGSEFLFYRTNQKGEFFRLDKFKYQDLNVFFSTPNLYETKYFSSDHELYNSAISAAYQFGVQENVIDSFSYLKNSLRKLPLVCLSQLDLTPMAFNFSECYYLKSPNINESDFFSSNSLIGYDLEEVINDLSITHKNYDINLLIMMCQDSFTDIYGFAGDNTMNLLSKNFYIDQLWEPKILGKSKYAIIKNFKFLDVNPQATFTFSKKDFNCKRGDLLNFVRIRECLPSL